MALYSEACHARHSGPASPARAHAIVPGIHILGAFKQERRGWPGRSPAMTENESFFSFAARPLRARSRQRSGRADIDLDSSLGSSELPGGFATRTDQ
jgi:hypothetical protein